LSPISTGVGATDTAVTVVGTGFTPVSVAVLGSASLLTNYVSPTQLTATIPAASATVAGVFGITVVNPSPGGGRAVTTAPFAFNNLVPYVLSTSPSLANVGDSGTSITVTGNYFVNGSVVTVDSQPIPTNLVSPTLLSAQIPANLETVAGSHSVAVANPAPGGGVSSSTSFVVGSVSTDDGAQTDGIGQVDPQASLALVGIPSTDAPAVVSFHPNSERPLDTQSCTQDTPSSTCVGQVPFVPQVPPGMWCTTYGPPDAKGNRVCLVGTQNCGPASIAMAVAALYGMPSEGASLVQRVLTSKYGNSIPNMGDGNPRPLRKCKAWRKPISLERNPSTRGSESCNHR
jgi:hypothetical protein